MNLDIFTEPTNHERIDRVGLFQKAVPLGKVTHLARVDDADRNSRHAVPDNYTRLDAFVTEATNLWRHQLRRRSQKGRAAWPWARMKRLVDRYLPQPKILHPYPKDRFRARLAAGAV